MLPDAPVPHTPAQAQTRQELDLLVGEIAELTRSNLAPRDFAEALLQRLLQALAAPGGGSLEGLRRWLNGVGL
jgi:hypothetical protein